MSCCSAHPSVEPVFVRILIILQEDLDLVIHLVLDILAAETGDDSNDSKTQARQTSGPETDHVALLPRFARSSDDLGGNALDFGQGCRAQRKSCKETLDRRLGEAGGGSGTGN